MPSTVNKRCVVYILAKRVLSQTVSLKFLSKIIAIRFCETWNRILKACIALKPEGDEKWKPRISINLPDVYQIFFLKMYRKWELPNFQIYGFYDLVLFKSMKSTKTLKIIFFVLYDITYIQNRGNGNNYLNLPID